uniref:DUF882 domain-containing protein n=2 Tax=Cohaesibacter celericrescens TaxID=2067669 RepID=UPI003569538E
MARHQDHLSRFRPVNQASQQSPSGIKSPWFAAALACLLMFMMWFPTQATAANRSLTLYFTHTKETTTITYKRNGKFDADGLRQLNRFLRDWRRNESTQMDPALFDLIWQVYKETGAKKPIHVVSAYRSPATNNMLRSRSRGVAKNSRHTKGQAMDFYLPGVSVETIRNVGLRMQAGGVGYYPSSRSPFVHIDTGNVRHWPRMSRKQLAKVFPKGKTVHVPRDGKPFSGYKVAKAQVAKRKADMIRSSRSVRRFSQVAKAAPSTKKPTKVQLAKLSQKQQQEKTSLLQSLLNQKPKQPPKPVLNTQITPAPIDLQGTPTGGPFAATPDSAMPRQLATLPKRPQNRPDPALRDQVPQAPLPSDETTAEIAVAQASEQEEQPKAQEPVTMASLPRARPASAKQKPFQLASAEPITVLDPIKSQVENQDQTDKDTTVAETPTSGDTLTLASLPKARLTAEKSAERTLIAPDSVEPATAIEPDASASAVLASMTQSKPADDKDQPSNRFAYAASDETFVAALPTQRPRARLQKELNELGVASLPQDAKRTQLAGLTSPLLTPPEATANTLAALPRTARPASSSVVTKTPAPQQRSQSNQMAKLTFAFGPSGMAHFAHMKQSTKTATFARLSRPIPANLHGLVSKPTSMIEQTFSHQTSQQIGDAHFAGAAIAHMAVRSFN